MSPSILAHDELEGRIDLTEREKQILEKERIINAELDSKILQNPNKFPKSIYYIVPNEMCERFCYYGIKILLNLYMQKAFGFPEYIAKSQSHLFNGLVYFFPLVGAAISDSFLGKYHTIVYFSIIYLIGNALMTLFAVNGLVGTYGSYPFWAYILPALLIALGTGGIKPCVGAHGGDQFLSTQTTLLDRFFSIFYMAVNLGAFMSQFITPYIRNYMTCFGAPCYFVAYLIPTVGFALALITFILGFKTYRIVPPSGEFLPWKALKLTILAAKRNFNATPQEKAAKKHWLSFAEDEYGAEFVEETRLLGKVVVAASPVVFFWMLYDQNGTEWQNQYEKMDPKLFGVVPIPTEASSNFNTILILIFVPTLVYYVYPFLEKRGIKMPLMRRMLVGYFFVILSFVVSTCLDYVVNSRAHHMVKKGADVISCDGCLNGTWQLPQWILLSLGEAMLSPTLNQFAYTQVGRQLKSSSTSIILLFIAFGNYFVLAMEYILHGISSTTVHMWIYIAVASFFYLVFIYLGTYWFVSKEDELLMMEKEKFQTTTEIEFKAK